MVNVLAKILQGDGVPEGSAICDITGRQLIEAFNLGIPCFIHYQLPDTGAALQNHVLTMITGCYYDSGEEVFSMSELSSAVSILIPEADLDKKLTITVAI